MLAAQAHDLAGHQHHLDRKSTRLNSSHPSISYAVFCLKKKNKKKTDYCSQLAYVYKNNRLCASTIDCLSLAELIPTKSSERFVEFPLHHFTPMHPLLP